MQRRKLYTVFEYGTGKIIEEFYFYEGSGSTVELDISSGSASLTSDTTYIPTGKRSPQNLQAMLPSRNRSLASFSEWARKSRLLMFALRHLGHRK